MSDGPVGDGRVGDGRVGDGPVGDGRVGDGPVGDGPVVTTVLGDVDPAALGVVLPHEHLVSLATDQWAPPDDLAGLREAVQPVSLDRRGRVQQEPFFYRAVMQNVDLATTVSEVDHFVAAGGGTIVDLSVPGFGRDPVALRAVALLTGVHVVMGCGEYVEPSHSAYVRGASERQITDVLVRELTEGVGRAGIQAGIIGEIGIGNPATAAERKVMRACVAASQETGVAVNLHRSVFPDPLAILPVVDEALALGLPPDRLVVSHCDERPEPELALAVAQRGVWVELDTFGMEQWAAGWAQRGVPAARAYDHHRVVMVDALLAGGYLDQVLLSQDVAMRPQQVAGGGWGYAHLSRTIEPWLRARGVSGPDLHRIRVDNPRRLLSHPPY